MDRLLVDYADLLPKPQGIVGSQWPAIQEQRTYNHTVRSVAVQPVAVHAVDIIQWISTVVMQSVAVHSVVMSSGSTASGSALSAATASKAATDQKMGRTAAATSRLKLIFQSPSAP